jgi:nitrogen PTS system EIIA component
MRLDSLTEPELIFPDLDSPDRDAVLRTLAARVAAHEGLADVDGLYERLLEREQLGSTGVGSGVAIPHCKLEGLSEVVMAVGISREGIEFGAIDTEPVRLFFLVVSPTEAPAAHLQVLASISRWLKKNSHVSRLLALHDRQKIFHLLEEEG